MGMYTEFHFNAEVRGSSPASVIEILKFMVDGTVSEPEEKPCHPLFRTDRWEGMLRCDSYYFAADTNSTFRYDTISKAYFLCVRCNFKNYDDEIQKFIDWIKPYIVAEEGDFLGFYRYEERQQPSLGVS